MTAAEFIDEFRGHHSLFMRMFECEKPIIGAINGWAMGGFMDGAIYPHHRRLGAGGYRAAEVRHGSNTGLIWTLLAGFRQPGSVIP